VVFLWIFCYTKGDFTSQMMIKRMYIKKIDRPPVAVNWELREKYRNNGMKRR
jgi:hypothetical protein